MARHNSTLSALESCTGGLLASMLTDVPGAGYFLGGAVAYSPEAKARFGVPEEVMERCGLVSREVALAMAECAARWFNTDFGVGVTGVAGPDPEDGIPPGTAFAAVWSRGRAAAVVPIEVFCDDRKTAKAQIAELAVGLLLEELDQ
jgi:nicotinamide-nucleotide amidase